MYMNISKTCEGVFTINEVYDFKRDDFRHFPAQMYRMNIPFKVIGITDPILFQ